MTQFWTKNRPMPEFLIALGTLIFAGVVFYQTTLIPVSVTYAKVGPNIMAYLISIILAVLGILLMIAALKGGWQEAEEKEKTLDFAAVAWVLLGLGLNVAFITNLGFTIASIALFVCIARGFGSRDYLKNAGIAAIFALIAYFGFVKLLNINIGGGIIENALERLF
jgi:putative tricarboxylic transport membrane protein